MGVQEKHWWATHSLPSPGEGQLHSTVVRLKTQVSFLTPLFSQPTCHWSANATGSPFQTDSESGPAPLSAAGPAIPRRDDCNSQFPRCQLCSPPPVPRRGAREWGSRMWVRSPHTSAPDPPVPAGSLTRRDSTLTAAPPTPPLPPASGLFREHAHLSRARNPGLGVTHTAWLAHSPPSHTVTQ